MPSCFLGFMLFFFMPFMLFVIKTLLLDSGFFSLSISLGFSCDTLLLSDSSGFSSLFSLVLFFFKPFMLFMSLIGRDPVAVVKRAVHPHSKSARRVELRNLTGAGAEIRQLFCVDPDFDRMPVDHQFVLGE